MIIIMIRTGNVFPFDPVGKIESGELIFFGSISNWSFFISKYFCFFIYLFFF